ncbi:MAG: hypothetical protein NTY41_13740 [Proteobacteria bacterium]|nr:hypothetical protein [Pseudomonadota bacterium]
MKSVFTWGTVFAACLLSSFQVIAQSPPMQVPMAPQAIEAQMQQRRTLKQREAIEATKDQPAAAAKPAAPVVAAAPAATDCKAKAVGKDGKPLRRAARAAFLKKCEGGAAGLRTQDQAAKQKP